MNNNVLKYLFVVLLINSFFNFQTMLYANLNESVEVMPLQCHPKLRPIFSKILRLPEARKLISEIQKEGPFEICLNNASQVSAQFGAFWDAYTRQIMIHHSSNLDEGKVIASIIFELHNAAVSRKYDQIFDLAEQNKIDKENFVKSIEFLEYQNSIKAAKMAEKGIQLNLFPANAKLSTYSCFEEHYHYQKVGGHSAVLGRNYDGLRLLRNR